MMPLWISLIHILKVSPIKSKEVINMANEDEACMAVPDTERSDREKLARSREIRHHKQDEILAQMSYTWDSNVKAWWSDDLESLPLLKDSEARAIASEILDFVIK